MEEGGGMETTCLATGDLVVGTCWLFCRAVGPIACAHVEEELVKV